MAFVLTDLRADMDALLANQVDLSTWSTTLKESAVREALLTYSLYGPAYEVDVEVETAGHEQELAGLPNLLVIDAIAWPWSDGLLLEDHAVRWRRTGATRVRIDRAAPQVGDLLRVRFRQAHQVAGLDGASATTVADAHRSTLAVGATAAALGLRLRQVSENPALPREAALQIEALRAARAADYAALLERLNGAVRGPVWAGVGL